MLRPASWLRSVWGEWKIYLPLYLYFIIIIWMRNKKAEKLQSINCYRFEYFHHKYLNLFVRAAASEIKLETFPSSFAPLTHWFHGIFFSFSILSISLLLRQISDQPIPKRHIRSACFRFPSLSSRYHFHISSTISSILCVSGNNLIYVTRDCT